MIFFLEYDFVPIKLLLYSRNITAFKTTKYNVILRELRSIYILVLNMQRVLNISRNLTETDILKYRRLHD